MPRRIPGKQSCLQGPPRPFFAALHSGLGDSSLLCLVPSLPPTGLQQLPWTSPPQLQQQAQLRAVMKAAENLLFCPSGFHSSVRTGKTNEGGGDW